MEPSILLTFDVEEFDAPIEYGHDLDLETQIDYCCRGLDPLLKLLERLGISATFFTTGNFARHREDMVRSIASSHEIASHGLVHARLEPGDLAESKSVLESITGGNVRGFRRARMEATPHDEIAEAGYDYNASEHPVWIPGRYNNRKDPRQPYRTGSLLNIPASCTPRLRLPLFWLAFRHYPMWLYRRCAARVLASDGQLNLYFHPWEFTRLEGLGLPGIVSRGSGPKLLDRLAWFLEWIGERGRFQTMGSYADAWTSDSTRSADHCPNPDSH